MGSFCRADRSNRGYFIVFLALGMALLAATPYPAAEPAGE